MLSVKKGDIVLIISGKEKGKTGTILEVSPKTSKVIVENINIVSKHQKARKQNEQSGIIKKPAPIDVSNVQVICSTCSKATRVSHKVVEGKKARVCKKCGASLDKAMVKTVKKEAKKAEAPKTEVKKEAKTVKKETAKAPAAKTQKTTTAAKAQTTTKAKTTTRKTVASSGK